MNKNVIIRSLIGAAVVTLLVTTPRAHAENDISPSIDTKTPANWELRRYAQSGAVELISRVKAGSVSTVCSDGVCGVFIEPAAGCVPGATYPLLINTEKQVGVVPTRCAVIRQDGTGPARNVILLQQDTTLLRAMMAETDVSIAFPTQAGQMDVLNVSMTGIREVLADLLPGNASSLGPPTTGPRSPSSGSGASINNAPKPAPALIDL